jgi:hypothetical protein
MIDYLSNKIITTSSHKKIRYLLSSYAVISGIGLFGLVATTMLIMSSNNHTFFEASALVNNLTRALKLLNRILVASELTLIQVAIPKTCQLARLQGHLERVNFNLSA